MGAKPSWPWANKRGYEKKIIRSNRTSKIIVTKYLIFQTNLIQFTRNRKKDNIAYK
jgi:hypothetical protein